MWQRLVDQLSKWLPWSPSAQVWMLGVQYDTADPEQRDLFLEEFRSRVLLTYRSGISTPLQLVGGREIDSDTGWGCMLRVMQMMLAQCFLTVLLGREWRFQEERDLEPGSPYLAIISCFLDVPSAPFSLHGLVGAGQQLLGKEPSAWFGPTSAARAVGHLFEAAGSERGAGGGGGSAEGAPDFLHGLACVVFEDGPIFKKTVLDRFSSGCKQVILLVCRRLGLDAFNVAEYRAGIESCFELPAFQGLASGNSGSSAHFFVGTHDDCLLFLDPHRTHPALERLDDVRGELAATLRPERPHPLRWSRLNPSVCFGFLVGSSEEFLKLCDALSESPRGDVFEVLEEEPAYASRHGTETEDGDMVLVD